VCPAPRCRTELQIPRDEGKAEPVERLEKAALLALAEDEDEAGEEAEEGE
jgi:hypothetical protein